MADEPEFSNPKDLLTPVFFRIAQIQICIIYMFTGLEKLKGPSWWDGTAIWTVIANPQMVIMDFTWMRYFPLLVSILTFTTVIFEVYFIAAMLNEKSRKIWLGLGFMFHLGIGLVMGLIPFSLAMISTYFLFFDHKKYFHFNR